MAEEIKTGCPVCGNPDFVAFVDEGYATWRICSCCSFQAGVAYKSSDLPSWFATLRKIWVDGGMEWWSNSVSAPPGWNASAQLEKVDAVVRYVRSLDQPPLDFGCLRRRWFNCVYQIADIELQRRTWLNPPNGSPLWSYVEFCEEYPQIELLEFARDRGHLSAKEFELISSVRKVIDSHKATDDWDQAAILVDPSWHAVAAKADQVRQQLLKLTDDVVEQRYLMGLD